MSCLEENYGEFIPINMTYLPGLTYGYEHQCKFSFGENATHCVEKKVKENNWSKCDLTAIYFNRYVLYRMNVISGVG